MRKRNRGMYLIGLFLPAIILICTGGGWAGAAVGAISPWRALQALRGTAVQTATQQESLSNPFADFDFKDEAKGEATSGQTQTDIPFDSQYPITELFFTSSESSIVLRKDACYVKNATKLSAQDVQEQMLQPLDFKVEKNSDQPQILIMHTHATESYQPEGALSYDPAYSCRNTDTSQNMVAVGQVMAQTLNSLGYNTLQDQTLHDYPSYNGSYDKSKETVQAYLEKYPSIKVVLDVHRDAIERDGERIAPVVSINGTKYAQIMIISGADNGYMNMPNYKKNLRFATFLQNSASKLYPGLTRPILFDYRNYNQQLTTGSILIEVGSHASTLSQAKNSAKAVAISLANAFDGLQ